MVIYMMATGWMIKLMDMEYSLTLTMRNMRATGRMIFNMARVLRAGVTHTILKQLLPGNSIKEKRMEKEDLNGKMVLIMKGIS